MVGHGAARRAPRIAIAWQGLPYYAARLIRAGIESLHETVAVIGTRPKVPIRGMEEALGCDIIWIDENRETTWDALGLAVPEVMFHTGWSVRPFNKLGRSVKHHGGKVVAFVDNTPRQDLRQLVGALYYRLILSRRFDAIMVPGAAGRLLARKLGVPQHRVYEGMYGADPAVFGPTLGAVRRREFLFVGQFIERKGVGLLLEAFAKVRERHPAFRLRVIGSGPLRSILNADGVIVEDFLQASELAKRYREAAFFVLPSREDHWGLVLHEAALSGMVLLASSAVGAARDLIDETNGYVFPLGSPTDLAHVMEQAARLDNKRYARMSLRSIEKSKAFGPAAWAKSFRSILHFLLVDFEGYGASK